MAHDLVDRGTDAFGEVEVMERRRVRAMLDGVLVDYLQSGQGRGGG